MTAEQILAKIEKAGISESAFAYNEFDSEELGLGEMKEVHQYGGEGKGEHWESVKHFIDHDVYIRIVGEYTSYNGTEFYEGYGKEVTPKEKVITVYN